MQPSGFHPLFRHTDFPHAFLTTTHFGHIRPWCLLREVLGNHNPVQPRKASSFGFTLSNINFYMLTSPGGNSCGPGQKHNKSGNSRCNGRLLVLEIEMWKRRLMRIWKMEKGNCIFFLLPDLPRGTAIAAASAAASAVICRILHSGLE